MGVVRRPRLAIGSVLRKLERYGRYHTFTGHFGRAYGIRGKVKIFGESGQGLFGSWRGLFAISQGTSQASVAIPELNAEQHQR